MGFRLSYIDQDAEVPVSPGGGISERCLQFWPIGTRARLRLSRDLFTPRSLKSIFLQLGRFDLTLASTTICR